MRPKLLAAAAALALAACSGGDGDAAPSTTRPAGACPVTAARVAEVLGHAVTVDGEPSSSACTYVGDRGARVQIVVRSLAEEGFGPALEDVERRAGPTTPLPGGTVEGAERGWIAIVGRAVQLGAAGAETLVVVAVADPALDADAAQEVAATLAGEALPG